MNFGMAANPGRFILGGATLAVGGSGTLALCACNPGGNAELKTSKEEIRRGVEGEAKEQRIKLILSQSNHCPRKSALGGAALPGMAERVDETGPCYTRGQ